MIEAVSNNWPLFIISAALLVAAIVNLRALTVPNWLVLPLILAAIIPSAG